MGLGHRFKSAIAAFRFTSLTDITRLGGSYFYPISGKSTTYNANNELLDFMEVPEVNAVINIRARMRSRVNLEIIDETTGKPAKNYEYLVKVLRNPNWYQAQKEFIRQTCLFRDIFGNEIIYFNKASGMPFRSVKSMYTLPFNLVEVDTPSALPFYMYENPVITYKFKWGNNEYPLDSASVIHLNDNRVNINKDNWVTGTSKLSSLKVPINNIRAAYESRNIILNQRGPSMLLSNSGKDISGVAPFFKGEKEALQERIKNYGLLRGQDQFWLTSAAIQATALSVGNVNELGLFPEVEADFQKICDAFGVDRDMFSNEKGSTWENKKQGERATWNNTVIPESDEWVEALNETLELNKSGKKLIGTFDHIPALQDNLKERGAAMKMIVDALTAAINAGMITQEQAQRELAKYDIE